MSNAAPAIVMSTPCRQELPELIRISDSLEHEGRFQFLAVASNQDSIESVRSFQAQSGFEFPAYTALSHEAFEAFRVQAYPISILIDAQGRIRYCHKGYDEDLPWDLNQEIQSLLNEIDESDGT